MTHLEATMHQCLVEIKNQAFASHVLRGDWGQERPWDTILRDRWDQ